MEIQNVSGIAIVGVLMSMLLSIGVPIALMIVGKTKFHAKISTFFIGAGTFLLFAMVLEQILHLLVIKVGGLNEQSNRWLYYIYAAAAAAVFEETGRLIAMKFWMKKRLDFANGLMYGIGHGGFEAIMIGGLANINNLVSMLMINSGAMQQSLALLPKEMQSQTLEQLSALWTTSASLFFVSGIERVSALLLQIGLSLVIYKAVRTKKWGTAAIAYAVHFVVDFVAVAGKNDLSIWILEVFIFAAAIGTLLWSLHINKQEQ